MKRKSGTKREAIIAATSSTTASVFSSTTLTPSLFFLYATFSCCTALLCLDFPNTFYSNLYRASNCLRSLGTKLRHQLLFWKLLRLGDADSALDRLWQKKKAEKQQQ